METPIIQGRAGQHTGFQHIFSRDGVSAADHIRPDIVRHPVREGQQESACPGGDLHIALPDDSHPQGRALLVAARADEGNPGRAARHLRDLPRCISQHRAGRDQLAQLLPVNLKQAHHILIPFTFPDIH